MTLQEFYDELDKHDWYYEYSDDHGVWNRGQSEWNRLYIAAKDSLEFQALMKSFHQHYYSGKPWGTDKQPKPNRP